MASSKIISFFLDTTGFIPLYSFANLTFPSTKSKFPIFSVLFKKIDENSLTRVVRFLLILNSSLSSSTNMDNLSFFNF